MGNLLLNGQTAFTQTGTAAPVLASSVNLGSATFPAGHVIQTVTDQYVIPGALTISTTSNDYLGSDLQCSITPTANGNKLYIQAFINGIHQKGAVNRGLHSGFAYDANFSSGNGTTIGPKAVIADYQNYVDYAINLLTNLQYSIVVTVGTQAPSEGSASIIRPILQSNAGDTTIGANGTGGFGVCSMIVMEIQA